MIIFKRQVFFSVGQATKWNGDKMIQPIFGRNWFYWLPHISFNGGIPFKHACTDIGFSWLFYLFSITVYWRVYKHDGSKSII